MSGQRNYDSTVARIAGNIMSGMGRELGKDSAKDGKAVTWAVAMARLIVAETKRTEAVEPKP